MYAIEVISSNPDVAVALDRAIASLNSLQREFYFHRPPPALEQTALVLRNTVREVKDTLDWLANYRTTAKGNRQFIIGIVDGRLTRLPDYDSVFGGHRASEGLAVFTTHDIGEYVVDLVRYFRYYLVRYAISFIAPALKNHKDTRNCFFDLKEFKPDIQESLKTGGLCEEHQAELSKFLSPHTKEALDLLCKRVANDIPYGLVLKGGGVKGLALVGALLVLSDHIKFDVFCGTSAGAMAAVLLAAGYTPKELEDVFKNLDFNSFRNVKLFGKIRNFIRYRTRYNGAGIEDWMNERIRGRTQAVGRPQMADFKPRRAIVYSCSREGLIEFDSHGERSSTPAAYAVRCSAAIPGYFGGSAIDGADAFDGGLRENFPFTRFITKHPDKPVIGLCLRASDTPKKGKVSQLIDAVTTGDEPEIVRNHADKIVLIDPNPIDTIDFGLDDKDKQFLLAAGRAAALRYLAKYMPDSNIDANEMSTAERAENTLRERARVRWNRH